MKNWLVQQLEHLRNKSKKKITIFNIFKLFALSICLSSLLIFRTHVQDSPMLLAAKAVSQDNGVLGVFYHKPDQVPIRKDSFIKPEIYASSVIVIDADSFTVLYEKNADERRSIASTTKIMTALVALRDFSPTRKITIDPEDTAVGGSSMYLVSGEELLLQDLIKGLLVPSGNDAALTLSNEFQNYGKNIVEEMNDYAQALGLENTHFENTSGLDEENHYSSARDLARMANYAMKDFTIRSAVNIQEDVVYSIDGMYNHYLKTTNDLLGVVDGLNGVKTGYTQNAGQCLVASVEREGHQIITVVLNSPDRFAETEQVIEWAYDSYEWQ